MRLIKPLLLSTFLCSALIAGGLMAADKSDKSPATKPSATTRPTTGPTTKEAAGKPINKFCAVNQDDAVDPKVTIVYKGKVIGFCCEDCIKDFKKDPDKYMATLK